MVKFIEMDETVSLFTQLEQSKGPVILINEFDVKPEEADYFMKKGLFHAQKKRSDDCFLYIS